MNSIKEEVTQADYEDVPVSPVVKEEMARITNAVTPSLGDSEDLITYATEIANLRNQNENLMAEITRRDANETRNCINWGPCSMNDGNMAEAGDQSQ